MQAPHRNIFMEQKFHEITLRRMLSDILKFYSSAFHFFFKKGNAGHVTSWPTRVFTALLVWKTLP